MQSSIIMPRFNSRDTLFASVSIYGADMDQLTSTNVLTRFSLPASNRLLMKNSNAFQGIFFAIKRYTLHFLFILYAYATQLSNDWQHFTDLVVSVLWFLVTLVPFLPEATGDIDTTAVQLESPVSIYHKVNNSLMSLSNCAVGQSLKAITHPRDRMVIKKALGSYIKPRHIGFILEMNVLAIKPPPDVPQPYLDAEKILIVPESKLVSSVIMQRAEWASAHHVHKASEKVRIVYESAKIIAWCACAKIEMVTIHELNGYAWKDLHELSNLVQEEMRNLTSNTLSADDYIKIVDLDSGNQTIVFNVDGDNSPNISDYEPSMLQQLEPTPANNLSTGTSPSLEQPSPHEFSHTNSNSSSSHLIVFLTSGVSVNARSGVKQNVYRQVNAEFGVSIDSGYVRNPEKCVDDYAEPAVVVKYYSERQLWLAMNGFPLVNRGDEPLVIEFAPQPVSFKAIFCSLKKHDWLVRSSHKGSVS